MAITGLGGILFKGEPNSLMAKRAALLIKLLSSLAASSCGIPTKTASLLKDFIILLKSSVKSEVTLRVGLLTQNSDSNSPVGDRPPIELHQPQRFLQV